MQVQNCDNTGRKMSAEVYLSSMNSFKTISVEDSSISKEETIANQVVLHNVQLIRNLPNILRSNSTRLSRNRKLLNKTDTSSTEDGNSSLELNTSSSIDLDTEANYNKTASPKSHHQRKQVHNPLDIQYDIPDCNNNQNKNIFQNINLSNALNEPLSCEENEQKKRFKYSNKQKKCSLNKKSKKITARKSSRRTQTSRKKPDTLATVQDVNVMNTVGMQSTNLENDILFQPAYSPNFPKINDLNGFGTRPDDPSNIFYYNDVSNTEKICDTNLNYVTSYQPTDVDPAQPTVIQRDLTSNEFPTLENNSQQMLRDSYIGSNFLYGSDCKILYSCSCANCTSHDKDIVFYEDPVSTTTSNDDTEAELSACDLYTNIYDFNVNNSHIFGDSLMDFEKINFYCEEFGEDSYTTENICADNTGSNDTTGLIESSANVSSINQNESQNLQSNRYDRIQDICVESYPTEPVTHPKRTTRTEKSVFNEADISSYLNSENLMKENEKIPQGEELIQNAVPSDVPVTNTKCQTPESTKDLCVIQCSQCGKLFNKKHQLWKHFVRCNFYKENFKCPICNKMYRHKSSLAQHLRIAHNTSHGRHEKFYTCNKCSKSYVRFRAFQRHVLLHDD